jgi:5-methylcytosine-specific restriction protein A
MHEEIVSRIDPNKIVFVSIDWMKKYQGITEDDVPLGTGGSYERTSKHEINNFKDNEGYCYGYTPPDGKINLKKIKKTDIKIDSNGNHYMENVLLVFCGCNGIDKNRRIIGFYVGAELYEEEYWENYYNARVETKNAFLFENDKDRNIILPYSLNDGYGYGRSNKWYADKNDSNTIEFRRNIIIKIKSIIENTVKNEIEEANDDLLFKEGKQSSHNISYAMRNNDARKKCLEYYFPNNEHYKCQICTFDFEDFYGELGKKYIIVHHKKSITLVAREIGEHEINPRIDLIPVCPNCHSMIHKRNPPYDIEEIKEKIIISKSTTST